MDLHPCKKVNQLASGGTELNNGASKLTNGLVKLDDGAKELSTKLERAQRR